MTVTEGGEYERTPLLADNNTKPKIYFLYMANVLSAWTDGLYSFAVPLLLTQVFSDTLFPAAFFSFCTQLACFIFGTLLGTVLDNSSRKKTIVMSVVTQCVCINIGTLCLYMILRTSYHSGKGIPKVTDANILPWFAALNVAGSLSALGFMAEQVAVGRDWVVVLAGEDTSLLSKMNSMMTRIALFCKFAAPMVFGLITSYSVYISIYVLWAWTLFALLPELCFVLHIYHRVPALQIRIATSESQKNLLKNMVFGWQSYFKADICLASLGYVFLYLTALAPGSLLTAYLVTHHVNEIAISAFQGIAAAIGLFSTFLSSPLIKKYGLASAGNICVWFQWGMLAVSVAAFFAPLPFTISISVFLAFLALSRIGLWSFDLVERQIMQERVPKEQCGRINSAEYSLSNLFSLLSYALGMIFPNPSDFRWLVIISFGMVLLAAISFSAWARIDKNRKTYMDVYERVNE